MGNVLQKTGPAMRRSSPMLACLAAMSLLSHCPAYAGTAMVPIAVQAAGHAQSAPVSALPEHLVKPPVVQVSAGKADTEPNPLHRHPIRTADPTAPPTRDPALWSEAAAANSPVPNAPNPPALSFEGISAAANIALGGGTVAPPDTVGAAGPNHYVQAVNVAFRVWDKAGNPLTPAAFLSSLFAPLGPPCGTVNDGVPMVAYDQFADRWIISQTCAVRDPNNHQLIAVSKTGDPTGAYYLYDFVMPNLKQTFEATLGVWTDAYYMTDFQASSSFSLGAFAFEKAKMLIGDPTASYVYFDLEGLVSLANRDRLIVAASVDGLTPPPAGAPCPLVYFEADEYLDAGDRLRIFDFHADFVAPANSTFTERVGSPLAVAAFDPRTVPMSRAVVPQPAPATASNYLDANADRLMFRLAYRNFGSSESLLANHTVNAAVNPAYRAGVRFYELRRSTPAGAFTIAEQQTFAGAAGDSTHRWMGSIAMNHQHDIALGYSASSATVFPSIRYAAKLGTDAPGSGLAQGEQSIIAGGGSQTATHNRWGDYSAMTVDPTDDCTFWYTQEYFAANSASAWQTRIAKFAPGACTVSARGTISGTITYCATGLPFANALVQFSGGYSRATLADGTYSATLVPGTYTATSSAGGYGTGTVNNLVVTSGGATTFNACLLVIPDVGPKGKPTLIAENAVPANGVPDPNEMVTMSLPLRNVGLASTTNLVATLLEGGGVASLSEPQNYGVVVARGAVVTRPFTFVATGACGSDITLKLALQDGALDLGTIAYTVRLGTVTAVPVFAEAFDGVAAPLLPAGWTTMHSGSQIDWSSSGASPDTAPNAAFAPDVASVGTTELVTPAIAIPVGGAQLAFRNLYNLEARSDGMVLEISVNGGPFADITAGGHDFVSGGYNTTMSLNSPDLGGRAAWSGLSGGSAAAPAYINSKIDLPAAAAGQSVKLRWRVGTDASVIAAGAAGVRIDGITLTNFVSFCSPAPRTLDVDANNAYDALTDGLMVIRSLFGLTGTAVTNGATGAGATRSSAQINTHLGTIHQGLDVDGDGQVNGATDGLMILRYLFGLRGAALIAGAVSASATRASPEQIENFIRSLVP